MLLPKPLESMTEPELAKEIRQRLAYLAKNAPDDASYVFVSYSHKDAEVVYRTVLSWLRAGYNIYLDADFENHSSDTNWVTMMQEKLQERGCQLEDGPVKVLGAEIDFPILLAAGVPYLVDTAPAISPAPSVRRYSDGRVAQLALVKMLVEQVEHFLGFSYDFRYLQHGFVLLKDMFYFCE